MDETKEELCRLCLKLVEDSIDLFHYKNGHRIADLVKIICPIEISEDDKLPQKICSECLELIVDSIHLRDLSIMNDQELRQRLQETEEKFEEFEEQFEIEALDEAILSEFNETVVFEAPSKLVPDVARTFCEFCNVTFFNPSSYKRHQLRKHKNIRYSCDLCNIGFLKTKVDLEGHMRKMHLTRYGSVRFMYADKLSLDITELYEKVEDQLGLSCCFCPHMDYEEESLNDHLYSHLDVVDSGKMYCTFCPSLITTMEFFIEHTKSHNEKIKTHRCLVCNKTFPFDDKFLKHLRNHKDNQHKICFCPQCGKKFSKPKLMEDHIRFIHNKESLYQCIECGQGFGSKSALNGHIKRHRDGLKFHCPFCPKSFASHNLLNSHKSVHSTERVRIDGYDKLSSFLMTFLFSISALRMHKMSQTLQAPEDSQRSYETAWRQSTDLSLFDLR